MQTIGNYAFSGCVNLEEVIFEGDSQLDTIGTYAFQNCKSLKSITIPSGVTKINNQAFRNTGVVSRFRFRVRTLPSAHMYLRIAQIFPK